MPARATNENPNQPEDSGERFDRLIRNIPDGVYTLRFDAAGEMAFTYVSSRLCQLLNIDCQALLANSRLAFASVHPEDVDGLIRANENARLSLSPFNWEGRFSVRGETRWMRISSEPTPLPDNGSEWNGVVSDITERKQAEKLLLEKEARLHALFNGATDGIIVADVDTRQFVDANPQAGAMLGYSRDELLLLGVDDIHPAAEMPRVIEGFQRQARGEVVVVEQPIQRRDGSVFPADVSVAPIEINGKRYLAGFFRDISERKMAQAAVQRSEKRLATVLATASDGIHVLDDTGNVILCSQSFARMLGYSPDEAMRLNVADWEATIPRDELPAVLHALLDKPATFETKHRRKDGSVFDAEINANGIEIDGRRYLYASSRDITERTQAASALQERSARLGEAQRIAKIGSWELDLVANKLIWSDEIFRIFEIDQKKFGASYEAFLNTIHPDDREVVNAAYTRSLQTREPYSIVHRLQMPDGRVKHVHERCESEFDGAGKPLRSLGTVQDITEQVTAQEQIRLYAKLFECAGEAIVVTDHENKILEVNSAFTKLTGYHLDDVRGQNPRILASGSTPRETYQMMWAALAESGFWQGELWDRRKDGSIYPKWASISAIRDARGTVTHYVVSFTDISERKAAEERMERLARYDPLTGLFNRYSLQERLEQALASAQRDRRELALMFIDLDRFKLINDTLGHSIGDSLLVEVAQRLQSCVRESDIVARLGGDEFVTVLTGIDSAVAAAVIAADKMLHRLAELYRIGDRELHSSPSIGISVFPSDGTDAATLMKAADAAMYHAKEMGRNNIQFFTAEMNRAANERLSMEHELREAVVQQQFELHYQPQVCTCDGSTCGVEALVRWRHPEKGLIPPAKFIPLAEEVGLIEAMGKWVLDEACRQLALWKAEGIHPGKVAVNLSAHQLQSPRLLESVRNAMTIHGIEPGELELEVTESVAMADPEHAIGQLVALRGLGVELAIDDFGTGYSSLAYLKLLPIQTLKLDRAFVSDIDNDQNDAAISAATVALAHSLGLKVVAEGVENEAQRTFLAEHRCEILQGYLFSKPLPAHEAARYIRRHPTSMSVTEQQAK